MCGIAGIYNFREKSVSLGEIEVLVGAVTHRGPDGQGIWIDNKHQVALGHRRLSILDLSEKGKQPMSYGDGRHWITYNGEIYNFLEIKKELLKKGYIFSSDSDTEVILASYQEWGEKMLDKFNGMWAFAIFDTQKDELLLSRDRFGIKPLYYFRDENRLIFSSEVQAIHKILGNAHPLNTLVIQDIAAGSFLNHGTNQTYLENVFSLPGGYNLYVRDKQIKVNEWYTLKKIEVPKDFEQQAGRLKNLIKDASRIRLRSDVPIGTCLSGGVDSGGIVGIIDQEISQSEERSKNYSHKSFCASFPNTPIDETQKAQFLAKKFNLKLDVIKINAPTKNNLENAMKQCDGPMHALAFFPIWSLYHHIKQQGIVVTLDGQGPDEMLGGYRSLYEALTAAVELKKAGWFWDLFKTYSNQGETSQFSSKAFARKVLIIVIFKPIIVFICNILAKLGLPKYKNDLNKLINNKNHDFIPTKKSPGFSNSLDESLFSQFFQSPLPGILNQYDRCSMAHGVECRMPYMDYRIVEFIFSLPPESKVGGGYTKRVLREALRGIIPDEIRLEKFKIGFNAPIVDWFQGSLKEFMLKNMSTPDFLNSKYFDGKKLQNDFDKFLKDKNPSWNDAWKFWGPVHVSWWMEYNNINNP